MFSAETKFGRKVFRPKRFLAEKNFGRKHFRPKNVSAENIFVRIFFVRPSVRPSVVRPSAGRRKVLGSAITSFKKNVMKETLLEPNPPNPGGADRRDDNFSAEFFSTENFSAKIFSVEIFSAGNFATEKFFGRIVFVRIFFVRPSVRPSVVRPSAVRRKVLGGAVKNMQWCCHAHPN